MADLATTRLVLRQWREADLEPFAALNADPEVMRYFPAPLTRAQSDEFAGVVREIIERQGWGLWAVEVIDGPPFIGFVGLNRPRLAADFMPAIEIGWRLGREHWGHGYASEAATAALGFGFEQLDLPEIVSFTATINDRSIRVMRRVGMTHDPAGDFDHPNVADGPLRRHVLYRIARHRSGIARDRSTSPTERPAAGTATRIFTLPPAPRLPLALLAAGAPALAVILAAVIALNAVLLTVWHQWEA